MASDSGCPMLTFAETRGALLYICPVLYFSIASALDIARNKTPGRVGLQSSSVWLCIELVGHQDW